MAKRRGGGRTRRGGGKGGGRGEEEEEENRKLIRKGDGYGRNWGRGKYDSACSFITIFPLPHLLSFSKMRCVGFLFSSYIPLSDFCKCCAYLSDKYSSYFIMILLYIIHFWVSLIQSGLSVYSGNF